MKKVKLAILIIFFVCIVLAIAIYVNRYTCIDNIDSYKEIIEQGVLEVQIISNTGIMKATDDTQQIDEIIQILNKYKGKKTEQNVEMSEENYTIKLRSNVTTLEIVITPNNFEINQNYYTTPIDYFRDITIKMI